MPSDRPIFRIQTPTEEHLAAFHKDGYLALPDVFTDEARQGLIDEVLTYGPVREFLHLTDEERQEQNAPHGYFTRPWNDRRYWSDALIDAPLVTTLLNATVGPHYHFCHSALKLSLPGEGAIGYHQDHHHWFHENPVNLAEREKWYIQILYYPNGFTRGDANLKVIPGSHRVSPAADVSGETLLSGAYDTQAGQQLREERLELPPGSLVYLNARVYHAVEPKPKVSPQPYRLFAIDIFKEAGPPHRYTQEIPPEWMEIASPSRKILFQRPPYTPESWAK